MLRWSLPGDGVAAGAESTAEIVLLAAQMLSGLVNYTDVATMSDVNVCCGCMVGNLGNVYMCRLNVENCENCGDV